jgi:hypothetical protein
VGGPGPALKDIGVLTIPIMSEDRRYRRSLLLIVISFLAFENFGEKSPFSGQKGRCHTNWNRTRNVEVSWNCGYASDAQTDTGLHKKTGPAQTP